MVRYPPNAIVACIENYMQSTEDTGLVFVAIIGAFNVFLIARMRAINALIRYTELTIA